MGEYISREEVVKEIKSRIFDADDAWESGYNTAMEGIMEWIEHMPSADVQPVKRGRWIEKEAYEEDKQMGFNFQIVCSNCDEQNSVLYFDENSEPTEKYFMRTPWCPWCGARMDGDSE